jgi:mannose-1-phosphate guanylyltransferase
MKIFDPPDRHRRWAIILAGGEERRPLPHGRRLSGRIVPRQFSRIIGAKSLLEQSFERLRLLVDPEHTLTALTLSHERHYAAMTANLSPRQLVVQPANRGTAPAILYSLLRLSVRAPDAPVALIPSDHYVSDDRLFMRYVQRAFCAVERHGELIVLLGIPPETAETSYGWIDPAAHPIPTTLYPVYKVRAFWEKPAASFARQLFARGCLWNSFVVVARVQILIQAFEDKLPQLSHAFLRILPALETEYEPKALKQLYLGLPPASFSRGILANPGPNLAVLPVLGLHWSDLGNARRVMEMLCRVQTNRGCTNG